MSDSRDLRRQLRFTRCAAYAEGTHKNHQTQWRTFFLFCLYFDFSPLPASVDLLALYVQFLSSSFMASSIRNYLSGVKLLHVITGHPISPFTSYELRLTLRGLERLAQHVPSRAPPVTPDILLI